MDIMFVLSRINMITHIDRNASSNRVRARLWNVTNHSDLYIARCSPLASNETTPGLHQYQSILHIHTHKIQHTIRESMWKRLHTAQGPLLRRYIAIECVFFLSILNWA